MKREIKYQFLFPLTNRFQDHNGIWQEEKVDELEVHVVAYQHDGEVSDVDIDRVLFGASDLTPVIETLQFIDLNYDIKEYAKKEIEGDLLEYAITTAPEKFPSCAWH